MEEEMICPVCHELLRNPRVFSCGHSFCAECIVNSIVNDDTAKQLLAEYRIRCFSCREISNVGPKRLPKNFALANLIDRKIEYLQTSQLTNDLKCAECNKTDSLENTHICASCEEKILCANCIIKKHRSHDTYAYVSWDNVDKKRKMLQEKCGFLLSQKAELEKVQKNYETFLEFCHRFSGTFSNQSKEVGDKITVLENRVKSANSPTEEEIDELLEEINKLVLEENDLMTNMPYHSGHGLVNVLKGLFGEIVSKKSEDAFLNKTDID